MTCKNRETRQTTNPQATLQNNPFPPYTVADNVASIELKAKNGYVHVLRVPCDGSNTSSIIKNALPLLKRLWPFWVSKGGRYKKLYKTISREGRSSYNVPLHVFWMSLVYNTVDFPHKPKCKTHDWLDWTDGNIFIESNEVRSQRVFEEQSLFHSRFIRNFEAAASSWDKNPDSFCASTFRLIPGEKFCSCGKKFFACADRTACRLRRPEVHASSPDLPVSTEHKGELIDPEIAEAFRSVMKVPARGTRPKGYQPDAADPAWTAFMRYRGII